MKRIVIGLILVCGLSACTPKVLCDLHPLPGGGTDRCELVVTP